MGGRAVPIIKYLQSFLHSFGSLCFNESAEIPIVLLVLYPYHFLSLKSFNSVVQMSAFERFTDQFQSYRAMIFISNMEVNNDEQ